MIGHENWIELASLYSLGILEGRELVEFRAHLESGCSVCEDYLSKAYNSLALIPESLSSATPPPGLKAKIMNQIVREAGKGKSGKGPGSQSSLVWIIGIALGLAVIGLAAMLFSMKNELSTTHEKTAQLKQEISEKEAMIQKLSVRPAEPVVITSPEPKKVAEPEPVQSEMRTQPPPVQEKESFFKEDEMANGSNPPHRAPQIEEPRTVPTPELDETDKHKYQG